MEFIDTKIWISKNASLCRAFANRVTNIRLNITSSLESVNKGICDLVVVYTLYSPGAEFELIICNL